MRIIAGRFRGTALAAVGKGDAGNHLRPTTDRVRESIFNLLASHTGGFEGARVLDLFAGTGALGLEALSRGAAHVTFVEKNRAGQKLLAENIAKLRVADEVRVLKTDATRLPPAPAPCQLILLDPPYGQGLGEKALESALAGGWVAQAATILWEDSIAHPAFAGCNPVLTRKYGDTWVSVLEAGGIS